MKKTKEPLPAATDGYGEDVKVGDKITVLALRLAADGRPIDVGIERSDIRRGRVTSVNVTNGFNQRGFEWRDAKSSIFSSFTAGTYEGVRWIRGWPGAESSTIDALLAAAYLDRSAA
jgi:hypothetical protein